MKLGRLKRVAESGKKDSTRANKKGGRRPSKGGQLFTALLVDGFGRGPLVRRNADGLWPRLAPYVSTRPIPRMTKGLIGLKQRRNRLRMQNLNKEVWSGRNTYRVPPGRTASWRDQPRYSTTRPDRQRL
jgi:hypothetical protein